jgi:hypothetical protein
MADLSKESRANALKSGDRECGLLRIGQVKSETYIAQGREDNGANWQNSILRRLSVGIGAASVTMDEFQKTHIQLDPVLADFPKQTTKPC